MATQNPRRAVKRAAPKKTAVVKHSDVSSKQADPSVEVETEEVPESIKELVEDALVEGGAKVVPGSVEIRYLSNAEIQMANDITEVDHFVEGWNGWIRLRSLPARVMVEMLSGNDDAAAALSNGELDLGRMMRELVMGGVVQPPMTPDDYEMWLDRGAGSVIGIFRKIQEISNLKGLNPGTGQNKAFEEEVAQFRKTDE